MKPNVGIARLRQVQTHTDLVLRVRTSKTLVDGELVDGLTVYTPIYGRLNRIGFERESENAGDKYGNNGLFKLSTAVTVDIKDTDSIVCWADVILSSGTYVSHTGGKELAVEGSQNELEDRSENAYTLTSK